MGQYAQILELARQAARTAGAYVRDSRREGLIIDAKSKIDFVSDKDKKSEEIIRKMIHDVFPDHIFFGEESVYGDTPEEEQKQVEAFRDEDFIWAVDPIDGTVNYIRGFPQYAISIGVVHHCRPVVGVIYDPVHDDLYSAEEGCGAFLNGEPIHVSRAADPQDAIVNTSMPTFSMGVRREMVARIPLVSETFQSMRIWNCAAISLASVACGRSDADYETGIHLWDMCAGIVLVREAGGSVSMLDGSEYVLTAMGLIASNGGIHEAVVKALNP